MNSARLKLTIKSKAQSPCVRFIDLSRRNFGAMFLHLKIIFCVLVTITEVLTYDEIDEAIVENIEDTLYEDILKQSDKNENSVLGKDGRKGRLFWPPPSNSLFNFVGKIARDPQFSDFLDVLQDTYPLPRGLSYPYSEYDYVIVGAGSAGSVLAARLSEERNVTVLLLEAGKPESILTDIPAAAPLLQFTNYTWQYYMEPQPDVCKGMINGQCFWPRGKAVGGTSVINYMIYTRGRPQDWDRIAEKGNYGWSYNDVLKYYIKSENAKLDGLEKQPHRGRDGELSVEYVPKRTKLVEAFLEAGRILGTPTIDYNTPNVLGFGKVQVTMSKGHRCSAAKAFLHSHKRRQNLHILPESTATKILIDQQNLKAYGVEYIRDGVKTVVNARREVIISAGPIASPQLLMLSGIGPKTRLDSLGIPVLKDLPVGRTLYDHICFPGLIFSLNTTGVAISEKRDGNFKAVLEWLHNGDSMIASPGGVEGIGYIKTSLSEDPEPVPDVELISVGGSIVSDGGPGGSKAVRRGMRISDDVFNEAFGAIDDTDTWSSFLMLLHPKSVGYLELKDTNPLSHPLMYGNYLQDPRDVATLIAGIRYVQRLAATPPFQKLGAKIHAAQFPSCRDQVFDSDDYWECAIRSLTATLHHQIGTSRMGPAGDPLAVVDPKLRVHGVHNLRVVDSSVIPQTISAHTNAPAIMIGEKAGDIIREAWRK